MTCLCCSTGIDNSPKPLRNRPLTALLETTPLKTLLFSVCSYFTSQQPSFGVEQHFYELSRVFWTRIVSPSEDTNRDCKTTSEKGWAHARAGGRILPGVPSSHASPPSSSIPLAAAATPQAHLEEGNPAFQSMQSSPPPTPRKHQHRQGACWKGVPDPATTTVVPGMALGKTCWRCRNTG